MESIDKRYSRQIQLPEVGTQGQDKLRATQVLIVGMGGLGCPAAQYLVAAGVGKLGLMDHDRVDESNLHRQILYGNEDVGLPKVEAAKRALERLNLETQFTCYKEGLTIENAIGIIDQYDLIIDGTDNFQAKYLINDACIKVGKPWIYASIYKYEGQLSVFNYKNGPSYRCLFPQVPKKDISCEATGVLGVLPGILGTYQATEAIKLILGIGNALSGKLKIIHTLTMQEQLISFQRNEVIIQQTITNPLKPEELTCELQDTRNTYLDVREPHEQPKPSNPTLNIPLSELMERYLEVPTEPKIYVFCQSGIRSKKAISFLNERGYKNLINVEGGIETLLK